MRKRGSMQRSMDNFQHVGRPFPGNHYFNGSIGIDWEGTMKSIDDIRRITERTTSDHLLWTQAADRP